MLIVPAGHPLHDRDEVTLVELAEHELLLEARGTAFRDVLDAAAAEPGVELRCPAEFDGMRLLDLARLRRVRRRHRAGLRHPHRTRRDLAGDPGRRACHGRTVGLIRRRRSLPSTAAQRVVAEVVSEAVTWRSGYRDGVTGRSSRTGLSGHIRGTTPARGPRNRRNPAANGHPRTTP